mmetsp:Transcript_29056/g.70096  ORF Transcript_29056/g.70096 Transcript_29056/m.70096 type:complete len:92 (-) Transcript_29056:367-642(-)
MQGINRIIRLLNPIESMRDEVVYSESAVNASLNQLWDVAPALEPPECRALPGATRDELEGTGAEFVARCGHANDARHAPAPVGALKSGPHH